MERMIVAAWTAMGMVGGVAGVGGGVGAAPCAAWAQAATPAETKADHQPADTHECPGEAPIELDWKRLEAPLLINHRQLTQREHGEHGPGFLKAGEAYFDHHQPPTHIIFQATVTPAQGRDPEPFYAMYAARLLKEENTGRLAAIDEPVRISPEKSANTCGWFHPTIPWRVLFGSTLTAPSEEKAAGFQVGTRKYVWMFPKEMEVVYRDLRPVHRVLTNPTATTPPEAPEGFQGAVAKIIERPNYDAECSWSKDGRFVLYAHVRDKETHGRPDADIWVYDTQTRQNHEIVTADGYDGGPFFSPDGRLICYRSDRRGDDLLQIFVAELKFDADGVPVGIVGEHALTDDQNVNWAPYWHPSGRVIVYGSSGVAHSNYEVFAVEVDLKKSAGELRKRRVTFASGADVLPVFSDDGKYMMWTAQRGPMVEGESKPSSQLWIAEVNPAPGGFTDPEHLFDNVPDQRPEGPSVAAPAAQPTNK